MNARIVAGLEREIAAGRLPGAVLQVAHRGRMLVDLALGRRDPAGEAAMPRDAVFRIYSMTKPLVSVAVLMLMEEGRLQLADPVAAWLPELAGMRVQGPEGLVAPGLVAPGLVAPGLVAPGLVAPGLVAPGLVAPVRPVRLHDLLTHSSGLGYGDRAGPLPVNPRSMVPDAFLAAIAAVPLLHQPGAAWTYGFSTDVLGLVVEQVTGQRLGEFLAERVFGPLGMVDTGFQVEDAARLAQPFAADPLGGAAWLMPAQNFDPTVPALMHSGGAGALCTAADYMRFARMLLGGGTLEGVRILSTASVRLMTADHLGPGRGAPVGEAALQSPGYGFGLGVAVRLADGMASVPGAAGEYFWSGTAGTTFWVDPQEDLAVVFMAQAPGEMRLRLRRLVRQLVYQAL